MTARKRFTDAKKAIQQVPVRTSTPPRANEAYGEALARLLDASVRKGPLGAAEQRRLMETALRYSTVDRTGTAPPQLQALSVPRHLGTLPRTTPLSGLVTPAQKQRMLTSALALRLTDPQAKMLLRELMDTNIRQGGLPAGTTAHEVLMRAFFAHHQGDGDPAFRTYAMPVLEHWLGAHNQPGLWNVFIDGMQAQGRPLTLSSDRALIARAVRNRELPPLPPEAVPGPAKEKGTAPSPLPSRMQTLLESPFLQGTAGVDEWLGRLQARRDKLHAAVHLQDFDDALENVELVRGSFAALNQRDPTLGLAYSTGMDALKKELHALAHDGTAADVRLHPRAAARPVVLVGRLAPRGRVHAQGRQRTAPLGRQPGPPLPKLQKLARALFGADQLGALGRIQSHVVFTDAQHSYLDCLNCSTHFCEVLNRDRDGTDRMIDALLPPRAHAPYAGPGLTLDASPLSADFLLHAHALSTIDQWQAKTGDTTGAARARANWTAHAFDLETPKGTVRTSGSIDAYQRELVDLAVRTFSDVKAAGKDVQDRLLQVAARSLVLP